jgi:hypothetical protein
MDLELKGKGHPGLIQVKELPFAFEQDVLIESIALKRELVHVVVP